MDQPPRPAKWLDISLLILIGVILCAFIGWKFFPMDRYAALLPFAYTPSRTTHKNIAMTISSPAFQGGQSIPTAYTCDGKDVNPPLSFGDVPTSTKGLALIMHDPDAPSGDWLHWTLWNIAPETQGIAEGDIPPGAVQGMTDSGTAGYGGPCPPSGAHRYVFELYVLDATLDLPSGASRHDLEDAMQGHVLDRAELVGTYKRKP